MASRRRFLFYNGITRLSFPLETLGSFSHLSTLLTVLKSTTMGKISQADLSTLLKKALDQRAIKYDRVDDFKHFQDIKQCSCIGCSTTSLFLANSFFLPATSQFFLLSVLHLLLLVALQQMVVSFVAFCWWTDCLTISFSLYTLPSPH